MSVFSVVMTACLAALCIWCLCRYLATLRQNTNREALIWKTLAGCCFLMEGIFAFWEIGSNYAFYMTAALTLGLIGDVLLAIRRLTVKYHNAAYLIGMLSFAAGHLLYLLCLLHYNNPQPYWWAIAAGYTVVAVILTEIYCRKNSVHAGKFIYFGTAYMCLVFFFGGTALSLFLSAPSAGSCLLAAGAICFGMSDAMLCRQSFGREKSALVQTWLHIFYYAAQFLIALSLFFQP